MGMDGMDGQEINRTGMMERWIGENNSCWLLLPRPFHWCFSSGKDSVGINGPGGVM